MTTFSQALVVLSLLASTAFAQLESLQIEGPHEVEPGQLVRLSANTVENETPFWIVLEPIDLDYEAVDGGRRLLFSSGRQSSTSITVILLAQQFKEGRIVTRQIRRSISVGKKQADPSRPTPDVPQRPETPGRQPVEQSPIHATVLVAWPKIRTDAAKELSLSVAENIELVAEQSEGDGFGSKAEIWRELSSQNRRTLQIETTAWEPVALALQTSFKQLQLGDVQSHAFHLRAAAAAIREAFRKSQQAKRSALPIPANRRPSR